MRSPRERQASDWRDPLSLAELRACSRLLEPDFYARETVLVARELLGKVLLHGTTAGRIVEVEAYLGLDDLAAHASRGITKRTRVLFGPPAHAYVYLIYGMHFCLNLVTEPPGTPGCVLIRALEPLVGLEKMRARRGTAASPEALARGPGCLTAALEIGAAHNGRPVVSPHFCVLDWTASPAPTIASSPRIGIRQCRDWMLRFFDARSPCVSGPRNFRAAC